jgi:hypothetical protein
MSHVPIFRNDLFYANFHTTGHRIISDDVYGNIHDLWIYRYSPVIYHIFQPTVSRNIHDPCIYRFLQDSLIKRGPSNRYYQLTVPIPLLHMLSTKRQRLPLFRSCMKRVALLGVLYSLCYLHGLHNLTFDFGFTTCGDSA